MNWRSDNWLFEPHFEYEYKSYQIKGFAQYLLQRFEQNQFYPYIDQLKKQIQCLSVFTSARNALEDGYQGSIEAINLDQFKLTRGHFPEDPDSILTIDQILKLASKEFNSCVISGQVQLEIAKDQIHIEPVGIFNPQLNSGLLLFKNHHLARIYTYEYRLIRRPGPWYGHKDIRTALIQELPATIHTDPNQLKWRVMKARKDVSGANSYLIQTATELPHFETVLPIVKNYLIEQSEARN